MTLPLEGIRVIDLSNYVAGPSAARILSDLGAEVIKIETFAGDPWRQTGKAILKRGDEENPIYDVYNTGKASICVNIKNGKGLELLMKMLEEADIFITNIRSQSLRRMALDSETLCARFPKLIYATVNGFGEKGPDANTPGFDTVAFWNRSGFLQDMAESDLSRYPVCNPTGIGDCIAGSFLVSGILTALFNRQRAGRGEVIKISLYGAAIWVMSSMIIQAQPKYDRVFPMTRGMEGALTSKYLCKDGQWFQVNALDYERDAVKVYGLLGVEEEVRAIGIVDHMTKVQHNDELSVIFQKAFLSKTCEEWVEIFKEADIVSGAMSHFRDVASDEQAWVNGFIEHYTCRNGEVCMLPCQPIRFGSVQTEPSRTAAAPGEQTDEILRRFGYNESDILEMYRCGAVK